MPEPTRRRLALLVTVTVLVIVPALPGTALTGGGRPFSSVSALRGTEVLQPEEAGLELAHATPQASPA